MANGLKEKSEVTLSPLSLPRISGRPRETQLTFTPLNFQKSNLARKRNSQAGKVIIKTAPQGRLENERDVLKHFFNRLYIRQLLDETEDPPSLILQFVDDNILHASNVRTLESLDVKFVAKRVLQAIRALHEEGYTHTGMSANFLDTACIICL